MRKCGLKRASKHPAGCGGSFLRKLVDNYAQLKMDSGINNGSIDMTLTNHCRVISVLMTLLY